MLRTVLLPLLALAPPVVAAERARLPADVPQSGLLELTRQGEVALLPTHERQPFNALLFTRSGASCARIAHDMMDVPSWPQRWDMKDATVLERTPTSVRYEIQLDITLAPRIPGLIVSDGNRVVFNDVETGAQFIWTLEPLGSDGVNPKVLSTEAGCAMRYSLLEAPGKASGWVAVVRALESTAVDAANFAAALSSSRGFTKPEVAHAPLTEAGETAFATLAAHGTAIRLQRTPGQLPAVIVRRRIAKPANEVLWAIRDKRRYEEKIEVMKSVKDRGNASTYTIGAFGGRVGFSTSVTEQRSESAAGDITITERVSGGDLDHGTWTWRIRPVPGGTDVELMWNVDVAEGSAVMRTLAKTDPVARESLSLHMALALIGQLVGGAPLGPTALAKAP